jgi:hypothetical protein
MAEAKRGVGGHAASAVHDGGDAVHWHVDLTRKFGCRNAELFQFFGEVFSGMDRSAAIGAFSMIVRYFDIDGAGRASGPRKANAPLTVDANAVLALLSYVKRKNGCYLEASRGRR